MAEKVGEIYYDVDADVSGLPASEAQVKRSTQNMGKSFSNLNKQQARVSKTSQGVAKNMGGMGRSAGQVGIQLQQLTGQIQGGQNAMAALSMQAADIGIVMGAPLLGAIAGISASIGAALVPSLFDSTTATEALEEAQEKLGHAVEVNSAGIPILTQRIRELAKISREAAMAELAQEGINALDLIRTSAEGIGETITDEIDFERAIPGLERFNAAVEAGGGRADAAFGILEGRIATQDKSYIRLQSTIRQLNRELELSSDQSLVFLDALNRVNTEGTPEAIQNFQNVLGGLNQGFDMSNQELLALQSSMSEFFKAARDGSLTLEQVNRLQDTFNESLDKSSESAQEATSSLNELVDGLVNQANTVGMNERELAKYTATMLGASEGQLKNIDILYDYIEGKEEEIAADEKATQAKEKALQKYQQLNQKLQEQYAIVVEGKAPLEMQIEQYRQTAQAAGVSADEIQRNIDKMRELNAEREKQKEKKGSKFKDPFEDSPSLGGQGDNFLSDKQMQQLEQKRQHNEAMKQLEEEATETTRQAEEQRNQIRIANLQNMSNIFGNMAGLLKKSEGEQSGAYKALIGLQKGFAIASSIMAIQTNIANASKVGFPQNIPLIAGAVGQTAGIISTIQSASMGGARYNGGPVSANSMYEVGERNKPELLMQGSRQYLIPGNNGQVVSNKDMNGGGTNIQVNVKNYSGGPVDVQQGKGRDGRETVDIIVGNIRRRGSVFKAITDTTTANNKTRGS